MTLNEKLSDMYDKILSLKDEVASASSRFESGDLDDDALKQGLNQLENQNFAQTRKVELATQDSKKYCLSLEADALAKSTGIRFPIVLRDAHIEAVKKEKTALQEDIRRMRNQKKENLARLHSLTLEADKLNSDEKRSKEKTPEDDSDEADFAALSAELEAAKEKDAFLRKSFEETATVLSRDQNDIRHMLDDLTNLAKRGKEIRQTLETNELLTSEGDMKSENKDNIAKDFFTSTSKSSALKLKISQCEKEIEAKCNQLRNAMESVNELLEMERQGKGKMIEDHSDS